MSSPPQRQLPGQPDRTRPTDHTTGAQYLERVRVQQDSVKWLAGALAGAGLSLGVGLRLTEMPAIAGYRIAATLTVCIAFLVVAVGLWSAFQVLTATSDIRGSRRAQGEAAAVKSRDDITNSNILVVKLLTSPMETLATKVEEQQTLTIDEFNDGFEHGDPAGDVASTVQRLPEVQHAGLELKDRNTSKGVPAPALDALIPNLTRLDSALEQWRAWMLHREVGKRLKFAQLSMAVAVVVAALAIGINLTLLGLSRDVGAIAPSASEGTLLLTQADAEEVRHAFEQSDGLPPSCKAPKTGEQVEVLVVGGQVSEPIVEVRKPGCPSNRITADQPVAPTEQKVEPVAVLAWLADADRSKVVSERKNPPRDVAQCTPPIVGPIDATLLAGTVDHPVRLWIHGTGHPNCGPLELDDIDPGTRVQFK